MIVPRAKDSRRIPAIIAGILFISAFRALPADLPSPPPPPALWATLFQEHAWTEARREALRAAPDDPRAAVIADVCVLRMRTDEWPAALERLKSAARNDRPPAAPTAALEVGRHELNRLHPTEAWPWFAQTLLTTTNADEFVEAGCALAWIGMHDRSLLEANPSLADQLAAGRSLWTPDRLRAISPRAGNGSLMSRVSLFPARLTVSIYRSLIRPAIGSRCNLQPSCSAYFMEASRRHGLAGIPMLADRLVREPGVNSRAEQPMVIPSGEIRYADELGDHDFWMGGKESR